MVDDVSTITMTLLHDHKRFLQPSPGAYRARDPKVTPIHGIAPDFRFRADGAAALMTGSGWIGEGLLCGLLGGDHLLVNQTFISGGYSR